MTATPKISEECKFCGEDRDLIDAHIYPRALAKGLGDDQDPPQQIAVNPEVHPKRIRTGWYDQHMLCAPCEKRFGPWDDYGIKFMRAPRTGVWPPSGKARLAIWEGWDYSRLKLFAIGVLWRAHASALEAFEGVQLGPHAPVMREMLELGDAGGPDDCAVLLGKAVGQPEPGLWIPPVKSRMKNGGVRVWRMHFGGFEVMVKTDKRPLPSDIRRLQLTPGQPVVASLTDFLDSGEARLVRNFFRKQGEPGF
jgi:hypothetical protein